MPEIRLTNLRAENSFEFRAACGLLHVLSERPAWSESTLRWRDGVATLDAPSSEEALLDELDDIYSTRAEDPRWSWAQEEGQIHRGTVSDYRRALESFSDHPGRVAWVRGTGTDQVVESILRKGKKEQRTFLLTGTSQFDFKAGGSGTSIFTVTRSTLRNLCVALSRREIISDGLFEGRIQHKVKHHLNWIAEQSIPGAYLGTTLKLVPKTAQLFLLALACESLAMFPVNARGGSPITAGFTSNGRMFSWGSWARPLRRDAVQRVLDYQELHRDQPDIAKLRDVGFTAAYRASRMTFDKECWITQPTPLLPTR